jgi:Protein of unknown function (DUF3300)
MSSAQGSGLRNLARAALVAVLTATVAAPEAVVLAQDASAQAAATPEESPTLPMDQLESLVAPIALFPDPLLAQMLVASTYPLDIVAAQQWLDKNKNLKGEELTKAAEKQPWDPSVQALCVLPDALKKLSENIAWTQDLGDAFLAQQKDVMEAVQVLRKKAKDAGKLDSTEQQKVETTTVENKTVIEIQPASTQVVYVPQYNPVAYWPAPVYPYPPVYYPPYYPGAALVSFGVGMAVGAAISGGWGYGCGWGGGNNTININNNNNFNRNSNRTNNVNRSGNSQWQHNASQRGGAPYKDKATANKYGGGARGDSASARSSQAQSRQQSASSRSSGGGAGGGNFDRSRSGSGGAGSGSRAGSSGGGSNVGSRSVSPSSSSRSSSSAFGGSQSGSKARSSSSRGSSSMSGSRGGGGGSRGGGGGGRRR